MEPLLFKLVLFGVLVASIGIIAQNIVIIEPMLLRLLLLWSPPRSNYCDSWVLVAQIIIMEPLLLKLLLLLSLVTPIGITAQIMVIIEPLLLRLLLLWSPCCSNYCYYWALVAPIVTIAQIIIIEPLLLRLLLLWSPCCSNYANYWALVAQIVIIAQIFVINWALVARAFIFEIVLFIYSNCDWASVAHIVIIEPLVLWCPFC